jgi:hypothetical protein
MKKLLILSIFISTLSFAQTRVKDSIFLVNGGVCVFADFDGYVSPGNYTALASNINGNTARIDSAINYAKELLYPFNIVVTTDSTLYFLANAHRRKRIANTSSTSIFPGLSGISAQNSMYNGNEDASLVFELIDYTPRERGAIIAHEIAHTLGLYHQVQSTFGTGETGVRVLMNASVTPTRNLELFWLGTNENGVTQDGIDIICNYYYGQYIESQGQYATGTGARLGDVGNSFSTAKFLQKDKTFNGFIGVRDSDYYKINIPSAQTVSFAVQPWNQGASNTNATLDVAIDLYDENRTLITSSTNTTVLNASISQSLAAGTYYVKVRADRGNANNPTGYGFMGHYYLTYTF